MTNGSDAGDGLGRALVPAALAAALLLGGCAAPLPPLSGRVATTALTDTAGTRLAVALADDVAAHPGLTGIHPLVNPRDAFAARVLLASAAERSIDAQYYIWHGDVVGLMMFEAMWQAAGRGVRVRLLLDDNGIGGLDPLLATLDAHPNIEVRLYNPFTQRHSRALGYLTDFARLNRRMHNKSFTVDNRIAIVGGRNVGNEYFAVGTGMAFADLDVAVVGQVVPAVSDQFDQYWNSASAYPAAAFVGPAGPEAAAGLQQRFSENRSGPEAATYVEAVRTTPVVRDIVERRLTFEWATARLVHDDPAKTLDQEGRLELLLLPELLRLSGPPATSLDLVSPYFVPGDAGTAALAALAARGVKVRILTNSLAASDVAAVHAGYAKRREALLRAGVQLFELKPHAAQESGDEKMGFGSSSSSGLHAKTFAIDRTRIFVGSFNFDPRSARLNTEIGLLIDSPALAGELARSFDETVPHLAYEVRLRADGSTLEWIERTRAGERRYDSEPGTGAWRRLGVQFMSILPIEWLL